MKNKQIDMTEIATHSNFSELIDSVYQTHCVLHQNAQKAININLTLRNWLIGYYTVEFEQNGEDRAKYGTRLLEEMAKVLKVKGLKGYSSIALRNCRKFYRLYPQIQQSVAVELQKIGNNAHKLLSLRALQIQQTVSVELQTAENHDVPIRGTVKSIAVKCL